MQSAPVGATPRAASRAPLRRRSRARRATVVGGLVVVLSVVLSGCQTDNTPTAYNDLVKNAFMASCTGDLPPIDGVTTTIASKGYCGCAYDVFANNVPYNDEDKTNRDNGKFKDYRGQVFVDLERDLKEDPAKINDDNVVPKAIRDLLAACPKNDENIGSGTSVPAAGSTGTQAPANTSVGPIPGTQPAATGATPPGTTTG